MELFNDGFIWRYLHVFMGIIWIGLLYYFNFVQTPFFAETDAATKGGATQKLVPRALWWFRWAAAWTGVTGLILFYLRWPMKGLLSAPGGFTMTLGVVFGLTMLLNVWGIIWRKQKIVIASALAVAGGGKADPNAAAAAARASVASRTNTLLSIPMLLFMTMGSHNPIQLNMQSSMSMIAIIVGFGLWALIEANAIWGKLHVPLASVKNVITSGFVLTFVLYFVIRMGSTLAGG